MSVETQPIRDLKAHLASLDEREREEVAAAEVVIDLALLLHDLRKRRGMSQAEVAGVLGASQQAVSHMERAHPNYSIATLCRYLGAMGYGLEIIVTEPPDNEPVDRVVYRPGIGTPHDDAAPRPS